MITYQKSGLLQNKLLVCTAPDYYIVLAKSPRFGFPRRLHSLLGVYSKNVRLANSETFEVPETIKGGLLIVSEERYGRCAMFRVMYQARNQNSIKEITDWGSELTFTLQRIDSSENRNVLITNTDLETTFFIRFIPSYR